MSGGAICVNEMAWVCRSLGRKVVALYSTNLEVVGSSPRFSYIYTIKLNVLGNRERSPFCFFGQNLSNFAGCDETPVAYSKNSVSQKNLKS